MASFYVRMLIGYNLEWNAMDFLLQRYFREKVNGLDLSKWLNVNPEEIIWVVKEGLFLI